jgi:hypothetical protein
MQANSSQQLPLSGLHNTRSKLHHTCCTQPQAVTQADNAVAVAVAVLAAKNIQAC